MQKIATRVFIYSSIVFGTVGLVMVLTGTDPDENGTGLEMVLGRLLMGSVFVVLSSFALSVAGKYLSK